MHINHILTHSELTNKINDIIIATIERDGRLFRCHNKELHSILKSIKCSKVVKKGEGTFIYFTDAVFSFELHPYDGSRKQQLLELTTDVKIPLNQTFTEHFFDTEIDSILSDICCVIYEQIVDFYKCQTPVYSGRESFSFAAYRVLHLFLHMWDVLGSFIDPSFLFYGLRHTMYTMEYIPPDQVEAIRVASTFLEHNAQLYEDDQGLLLLFTPDLEHDFELEYWLDICLAKKDGEFIPCMDSKFKHKLIKRYKLSLDLVS